MPIPARAHPAAIVPALLISLGAAPGAAAESPRFVLISRALGQDPVRLGAIGERLVRYTDARGVERQASRTEILAMAPGSWHPAPHQGPAAPAPGPRRETADPAVTEPDTSIGRWAPPGAVIELSDGQRFTGRPTPAADLNGPDPDFIAWDHPRLGRLRFSLEDVSRVVLSDAGEMGANPAHGAEGAAGRDDEVTLLNGDRLTGLIESLQPNLLIRTGSGVIVETSLDRAASVRLASGRRDPAGTVVWLNDGSVVIVNQIESGEDGTLSISLPPTVSPRTEDRTPGLSREPWVLDELVAVNFDAAVLRPLAGMRLVRQETAPDRRRAAPVQTSDDPTAPLGAPDIELPGPMVAEWSLPAGSAGLIAALEMPERSWTWGDCVAVVSAIGTGGGETELARERLNASRPIATLKLDLPATTARLRITIDPGEHGPIQDRVLVRRAMVLSAPDRRR